MLFQKIKIDRVPGSDKPVEHWYMILRTFSDVLAYTKIDASLFWDALKALPESISKSHLEGSREIMLNISITTDLTLNGKDNFNVLNHLNKLVGDKAKNMVEIIAKDNYVLVQQSGGYCSYKEYIDIWNAHITDEIEKDNCYFPMDCEIIDTDLLFIENGERVPVDFERKVRELMGCDYKSWFIVNNNHNYERFKRTPENAKIVYKLSLLKLRDPDFTAKMITKAKAVAVETHLADAGQLDKIMGLFSMLTGKTIYIKTNFKDQLMEHPLYKKCSEQHTVTFVS